MNINFLLPEEVNIELQVRDLDPAGSDSRDALKARLEDEELGKVLVPDSLHHSASRNPKRELSFCLQVINEYHKWLNDAAFEIRATSEALVRAEARLMHFRGRLQRLRKSPKYGAKAVRAAERCSQMLLIVMAKCNGSDASLNDTLTKLRQTPSFLVADECDSENEDNTCENVTNRDQPLTNHSQEDAMDRIVSEVFSSSFSPQLASGVPTVSRNPISSSQPFTSTYVPIPHASHQNIGTLLNIVPSNQFRQSSPIRSSANPASLIPIHPNSQNRQYDFVPPQQSSARTVQFTGVSTGVTGLNKIYDQASGPSHDIYQSAVHGKVSSFKRSGSVIPGSEEIPSNMYGNPANLLSIAGSSRPTPQVQSSSYVPSRDLFPPFVNHPSSMVPQASVNRPAHNYRGLVNCKLTYDGSPGGLPIESFIFRLERTAHSLGLPRDMLVDEIAHVLRGTAQDWYWCHLELNPVMTWERLSTDLIARFQDRRTTYDVRRLIEGRKQSRKESIIEFYNEIRALTLQSRTVFPESEILHYVRRNMRASLQIALADRQFNSINELIQSCVALEDTWSRLGCDPEPTYAPRRYIHELHHDSYGNPQEFIEEPCVEPHYYPSSQINAISSANLRPPIPTNVPPRNVRFHESPIDRNHNNAEPQKLKPSFQQAFSTEPQLC